jgi:hypothetical protein
LLPLLARLLLLWILLLLLLLALPLVPLLQWLVLLLLLLLPWVAAVSAAGRLPSPTRESSRTCWQKLPSLVNSPAGHGAAPAEEIHP